MDAVIQRIKSTIDLKYVGKQFILFLPRARRPMDGTIPIHTER